MVTAYEPDGKSLRLGKNGNPLSLDEWVDSLVAEANHLFEPNAGSGSPSSNSMDGFLLQNNPFTTTHFNLTKAGEISKKDPALARRLEEAAIAAGKHRYKKSLNN